MLSLAANDNLGAGRLLVLVAVLLGVASCASDPVDPDPSYDGYTMVWSDEFDAGLSSENWTFELGDGTDYGLPPGWGNNERQLYTSSQNNVLVRADGDGNSVLSITARDEPGDNQYSSAKLTTQGLQSFRFGRIEARIRIPEGRGMWPAFWLLGENITEVDWPGCGEIDIMEVIGHEPSVIHSSAHYTNDEKKLESNTNSLDAGVNLSAGYHLYRLEWTPERLEYSLDGQVVNSVAIEADMKEFLRPHYLIFNVAVGGNWPGDPDAATVFPQSMLVDWVRVFQKDDLNVPSIPPLDINEETIGVLANNIAQHAFNDARDQFPGIGLKSFGAGGEPTVAASGEAIDGDSCLILTYPGENWGGAFFELEETVDMSQFANGNLVFSIQKTAQIDDIEIKLESTATQVSLFLADYSGEEAGNGFIEYRIPMTDFAGLDLTDVRIPFALWNPVDINDGYLAGIVLLDNIYFE